MTKTTRVLLGLGAVLAAAMVSSRPGVAVPRPPAPSFRPLDVSRLRLSHCTFATGVSLQVKALSTPKLGEELMLEVSARNMRASGSFHCSLRVPPGALQPVDDTFTSTRDLPQGQLVTWTVHTRVMLRGPIPVVAEVVPVADPGVAVRPMDARIVLFPMQLKDGLLSAAFSDPTTFPVGSPLRYRKLPDGHTELLLRGVATYLPDGAGAK